jgi:hypothetical protein
MPATGSDVTYSPIVKPRIPGAAYPCSARYSIAIRSDQLSLMPWGEFSPTLGPAIIRLVMACVYSWAMTVMSKSPSTHGA